MNNPPVFELADSVDTTKKKEWSGYTMAIRFKTQDLVLDTEARFGPLKAEKLIDIESDLKRKGPHGGAVRNTKKDMWYEKQADGTEIEIPHSSVQYYVETDNGDQVVPKFDKTNIFDIDEQRDMGECTLDSEGVHRSGDKKDLPYYCNKALGTLIPLADVFNFRFKPEDMDVFWAPTSGHLKKLAEYLERNKLSIFTPFSHGNGRRMLSVCVCPIRRDKLYLVMVLNEGEILWTHALEGEAQTVEQRVVQLAPPPLVNRKRKQAQ